MESQLSNVETLMGVVANLVEPGYNGVISNNWMHFTNAQQEILVILVTMETENNNEALGEYINDLYWSELIPALKWS